MRVEVPRYELTFKVGLTRYIYSLMKGFLRLAKTAAVSLVWDW